jgi:hypothetical protein
LVVSVAGVLSVTTTITSTPNAASVHDAFQRERLVVHTAFISQTNVPVREANNKLDKVRLMNVFNIINHHQLKQGTHKHHTTHRTSGKTGHSTINYSHTIHSLTNSLANSLTHPAVLIMRCWNTLSAARVIILVLPTLESPKSNTFTSKSRHRSAPPPPPLPPPPPPPTISPSFLVSSTTTDRVPPPATVASEFPPAAINVCSATPGCVFPSSADPTSVPVLCFSPVRAVAFRGALDIHGGVTGDIMPFEIKALGSPFDIPLGNTRNDDNDGGDAPVRAPIVVGDVLLFVTESECRLRPPRMNAISASHPPIVGDEESHMFRSGAIALRRSSPRSSPPVMLLLPLLLSLSLFGGAGPRRKPDALRGLRFVFLVSSVAVVLAGPTFVVADLGATH